MAKLQDILKVFNKKRKAQNISRRIIAERSGFSDEAFVRKLEKENANPTLATLLRFEKGLGVEVHVHVKKTKVLTFFNHAGGAGKTSSLRETGYNLSQLGYKVLVIDVDPQANLTSWFGVKDQIEIEQTIYPAVIEINSGGLKLPPPIHVYGLDLIPSTLNLAKIDMQLPGIIMGLTRLREALRLQDKYDFILIDPPPSLGQLTALAVIAADHLVVPVPTTGKGLEGLETVTTMIETYKRAAPELNIAMFLVTKFDSRTSHDKQVLDALHKSVGHIAPVSSPVGSRPAVFQDAQALSLPIPLYQPNGKTTAELKVITVELLNHLGVKAHV